MDMDIIRKDVYSVETTAVTASDYEIVNFAVGTAVDYKVERTSLWNFVRNIWDVRGRGLTINEYNVVDGEIGCPYKSKDSRTVGVSFMEYVAVTLDSSFGCTTVELDIAALVDEDHMATCGTRSIYQNRSRKLR
jgi:hypothetical protein